MKIGGTTANSYNIWTSTSTGGSQTHLTGNTSASLNADDPPVLSPDGTMIAFASKAAINGSNNGTASSSYNIFVVSASGGTPTALTQNTNASLDSRGPVWSPDGTMIYFYSKTALNGTWNGTANANTNIWRVNANGTGMIALTSDNNASLPSQTPAISPDGTALCYVSKEKIGVTTPSSFNIWKMNYDGTAKGYLTSNTAASLDSLNCKWSSDGADIVFQSKMKVAGVTASSYNIWTMSSSGLNQVALTTNTAASLDSQMPSYSPDDTHIVFYSLQNVNSVSSGSNNIWIMKSDGTSQTAITQNVNGGLDSILGPFNVWYAP
jgi:Tol biopolymer transport system component